LIGLQTTTLGPAAYQRDRTTLLTFTPAYEPFNIGAQRSPMSKSDDLPGFVCQCVTVI